MKLAELYTLTWKIERKILKKHQKYEDAKTEVFKAIIKPEYRKLIKWVDWKE